MGARRVARHSQSGCESFYSHFSGRLRTVPAKLTLFLGRSPSFSAHPDFLRIRVFRGLKVKKAYLDTIALIERLHRECLEVIKADLDRQGIRDMNNVQA